MDKFLVWMKSIFATLNQFINGKLLILEKNDRINSLFETRAVDAETVNSIVILISDILVVLIFLWIIKKIVNFLYNKLRRKRNIKRNQQRQTQKKGMKLIANNKKAFHDYFIEDTYEAGIALAGTEVKSLRMGKCSIKESFIRVENGEVYIYGMHISPYEKGNIFNKDPLRIRKLLLHRYEINKIEAKLKEKGLTLVPLKVYFKDSLVKVEIGMARGKKLYDKRQDIAKKDQRREAEREFKVKNLY